MQGFTGFSYGSQTLGFRGKRTSTLPACQRATFLTYRQSVAMHQSSLGEKKCARVQKKPGKLYFRLLSAAMALYHLHSFFRSGSG